jgi:hypothetical protein
MNQLNNKPMLIRLLEHTGCYPAKGFGTTIICFLTGIVTKYTAYSFDDILKIFQMLAFFASFLAGCFTVAAIIHNWSSKRKDPCKPKRKIR